MEHEHGGNQVSLLKYAVNLISSELNQCLQGPSIGSDDFKIFKWLDKWQATQKFSLSSG